jgi:hypothetical protein
MATRSAKRNSVFGWLWFSCKVLIAGAVLGVLLGWLKSNVDPDFRWFAYPTAFLVWLAVSIALVFGAPMRSLRNRRHAKRSNSDA